MRFIAAAVASFLAVIGVVAMVSNPITRDTVLGDMSHSQQHLLLDRIQVHEGWHEGSRSMRNNNPGNIEYGPFAIRLGATGSDGRFAIFKSYEEGRHALHYLLFHTTTYPTLTVEEMVARYAPSTENDIEAYIRSLVDE